MKTEFEHTFEFFDNLGDPDKAKQYAAQGSEDWEQIRVGRFTASEIHRLMEPTKREMTETELKARPKSGAGSKSKLIYSDEGLSDTAKNYIKQKVAETLTGKAKISSYAYPLIYGKEMEAEAVEYFQERTGFVCEEIGFQVYTDFAGGSADRDIHSEDAILEIKCPYQSENQIDYLMLTDHYDVKRMHPEYFWQIQANIMFAGRSKGYLATYDPRYLDPRAKMQIIEIPAIPSDQDLIRLKIELAVKEKLELIKTLLP